MTRISLSNWMSQTLNIDNERTLTTLLHISSKDDLKSRTKALDTYTKEQLETLAHGLLSIQVIDIACGAGAFLIDTIEMLSILYVDVMAKLGTTIKHNEAAKYFCKNSVTGIDLQAQPLAVYTLCLMWRYSDENSWALDPRIICGNSLDDELFKDHSDIGRVIQNGGYDIVIGNPPYLGEKGSTDLFRAIKSTSFGKRYYEGKMDLSYFFTLRALEILKCKGVLTYLTTNYFITADGAVKYRKNLRDKSDFLEILNLNTYPIFKDALGQHNMIFMLLKSENLGDCCNETSLSNPIKTEVIYVKNEAHAERIDIDPEDILKGNIKSEYVSRYNCLSEKLYRPDGCITVMSDWHHKQALDAYKAFCDIQLKDVFNINQGIVSGADQVSASMLRNKLPEADVLVHSLEKGDPIFVFDDGHPALQDLENDRLRPFYKNSDIAAYVIQPRTKRWIAYMDVKVEDVGKRYPQIISHLSKFKPVLDGRREVAVGTRPWYCLQWPRKADVFEGPKIVVPQRSKINRFAYTDVPFYGSADIYYFKKKTFENPSLFDMVFDQTAWLYYLGVLNSAIMYMWLYHYGKRKGELLELYAKPLLETAVPSYKNEPWQREIANRLKEYIDNPSQMDGGKMKIIRDQVDDLIFNAMQLDCESQNTVLAFHRRYIEEKL